MREQSFYKYLIGNGYTQQSSQTRIKACKKIERELNVNLDSVVSSVIGFQKIIKKVYKIDTKKQKCQNALIHYFNFKNPGKKMRFHISYGESIRLKDLGKIIFDVNRAIDDVSASHNAQKSFINQTKVVNCKSGSLIIEVILNSLISACLETAIKEIVEVIKNRINKKKKKHFVWNVIYRGETITINKVSD